MARIEQGEVGEMLSAYLDGELSAAEVQVVERLLREDATARHLLEVLRRTVQATASLPRHPAPSSLLPDVQASLERSALLDDMPQTLVRRHHQRAPWTARLSMAAMLGLVVVGGWWFLQDPSRRTSPPPEDSLARSERAAAPADQSADEKKMVAARPVSTPAESPPAAAALASRSNERLTVDQKLAAGVELVALQSHAFAAESVRLQLSVGDAREREVVARRVAQRLAGERLTDLATEKSGGSAGAGKSQGFYYRGSSGTNFEAAGESQILVRATPRQIDRVLEDLVQSGQADASATLVAGTLSVQGLQKTQTVVGLLAQSQIAKSKESDALASRSSTKTAIGDRPPASTDDLVDGLLRVIGVDPQLVENPKPLVSALPTDDESGAKGSTPAPETKDPSAPAGVPLVDRRVTALEKAARESGTTLNEEPLVTLIIQVVPSSKTHQPPPKPAEPSKSGAK